LQRPDRVFEQFDHDTMRRVAHAAMPGVSIRDAFLLFEYDDYYYTTVSSFDSGLPRMAKPLPVLRVRYNDAADTWLYLTFAPGQILQSRARRSIARTGGATTGFTDWTSRSCIATARCGTSSRSCVLVGWWARRASPASCLRSVVSPGTRAQCKVRGTHRGTAFSTTVIEETWEFCRS
jgi:hypothetical protein